MPITRYVYVTDDKNNIDIHGSFEECCWLDIQTAFGLIGDFSTPESAQKIRSVVMKKHPNIPKGKILKLTLEIVEEEESSNKSDPFAM